MIDQHSQVIANRTTRHRTGSARFWEIDALRGFAIVQMVFFHFVWDLRFFNLIEANIFQGPWQWFARTIATQFIFLAGVSLTLSYTRELSQGRPFRFSKYLVRGLKVFGWGLVITVGTIFFVPDSFVIFGILHLIGFAIILGGLFLPVNKWLALLVGVAIIGFGLYIEPTVVDYPWLIWLGLKQRGVTMVDYYPAAPWAGLALVGIFTGHSLYSGGESRLALPGAWADNYLARGLRFLGRHSLVIYLIHQPILIGLFFVLGFAK